MIGGAATADGDGTTDGLTARPGEGVGRVRNRNASDGARVGGTPGGVGAWLPGTAPWAGRSLAGAQLVKLSATSVAARVTRRRRSSDIRLSLSTWLRKLKNKHDTADDRDMPTGINRALQVRAANRLRASLARDELSGLPLIGALTPDDQRELLEVGGGRLAAIAIRVSADSADSADSAGAVGEEVEGPAMREVTRMIDAHVRRTDLLGWLEARTLLLVAPGMEPVGGRSLAERLREVLTGCFVEVAGTQVPIRVSVGVAYRSAASPTGWTTRGLLAEAEVNAA